MTPLQGFIIRLQKAFEAIFGMFRRLQYVNKVTLETNTNVTEIDQRNSASWDAVKHQRPVPA